MVVDERGAERATMAMLPYVRHIARLYATRMVPLEDLICVGLEEIWQKWPEYDGGSASWTTYAYHQARSAIRHYLRDHGRIIKAPAYLVEQHLAVPDAMSENIGDDETMEPLAADPNPGPEEQVVSMMYRRYLLSTLPRRQRQILSGVIDGLTTKEIARRLGLSAATIPNFIFRARNNLRGLIRAERLSGGTVAGCTRYGRPRRGERVSEHRRRGGEGGHVCALDVEPEYAQVVKGATHPDGDGEGHGG